ncbi:expressed unknown protein [Seminavis robusta]|uniref:Uncharacterized protein n=1 Tax=Seminavis robusta TaxID=568900 RepID=A0A9N8EY09_9STRA|nr:expressed unknown protein [Seminavis robusta]|eukprot:Sro2032_g311870.1 n/a (296) ;mRNA; r:1597-2702
MNVESIVLYNDEEHREQTWDTIGVLPYLFFWSSMSSVVKPGLVLLLCWYVVRDLCLVFLVAPTAADAVKTLQSMKDNFCRASMDFFMAPYLRYVTVLILLDRAQREAGIGSAINKEDIENQSTLDMVAASIRPRQQWKLLRTIAFLFADVYFFILPVATFMLLPAYCQTLAGFDFSCVMFYMLPGAVMAGLLFRGTSREIDGAPKGRVWVVNVPYAEEWWNKGELRFDLDGAPVLDSCAEMAKDITSLLLFANVIVIELYARFVATDRNSKNESRNKMNEERWKEQPSLIRKGGG